MVFLGIQYGINQLRRFHNNGRSDTKCGSTGAPPARASECSCYKPSIPPNPCCIGAPHKPNARTFKYLFFFVGVPLIMFQTYMIHGVEQPMKEDCRDYEYMLVRTKRFPWGDGTRTLFHSDEHNHLPGECTEPKEDH